VLYEVRNLSSAGGTSSAGNGINDLGWVTGSSNLPGDTTAHSTVWIHGFRADLGTLGGPSSNVAWPVKSDDGIISGIAETNQPNPLGERWSCRFFFPGAATTLNCRGVVWEFGQIRALPLFPGGFNSFATGTTGAGRRWAGRERSPRPEPHRDRSPVPGGERDRLRPDAGAAPLRQHHRGDRAKR
jgi:uncharacterized membrane protein